MRYRIIAARIGIREDQVEDRHLARGKLSEIAYDNDVYRRDADEIKALGGQIINEGWRLRRIRVIGKDGQLITNPPEAKFLYDRLDGHLYRL